MRTQREVRQRAPIWFVVLLAFNIALMTYDARDPVTKQRMFRVWLQTPVSLFQTGSSAAGDAGAGVFGSLRDLPRARSENHELRIRVAELESELRVREAAAAENNRLRGLLDLRDAGQFETITARVIGRDPSAWFSGVTINRGSTHGVELNMPVVTAGGIVGRIVGVGPVSSQILLITDERAGAGAVIGQLGASTAIGTVQGLGRSGLLRMEYVSALEKVATGDFVLTTGQDRIYPPGLSVGRVAEVKEGAATATHTIYVEPTAELGSLRQVAVLRYRPPQRDETPAQQLPNLERRRR